MSDGHALKLYQLRQDNHFLTLWTDSNSGELFLTAREYAYTEDYGTDWATSRSVDVHVTADVLDKLAAAARRYEETTP